MQYTTLEIIPSFMPGVIEMLCQQILTRLQQELNPKLVYHNSLHTMDVIKQARAIALSEGVKPGQDLNLLLIAAAYHDCGFLYTYKNHEEKGCEIARNDLASYFPQSDLEKICGMIMATKIPQSPHTLLEQILCDADLDYLGRPDFEPISRNLYQEFLDFSILCKEDPWDDIQIRFFEQHRYFTQSSSAKRNPVKMQHLHELKVRRNCPL